MGFLEIPSRFVGFIGTLYGSLDLLGLVEALFERILQDPQRSFQVSIGIVGISGGFWRLIGLINTKFMPNLSVELVTLTAGCIRKFLPAKNLKSKKIIELKF